MVHRAQALRVLIPPRGAPFFAAFQWRSRGVDVPLGVAMLQMRQSHKGGSWSYRRGFPRLPPSFSVVLLALLRVVVLSRSLLNRRASLPREGAMVFGALVLKLKYLQRERTRWFHVRCIPGGLTVNASSRLEVRPVANADFAWQWPG